MFLRSEMPPPEVYFINKQALKIYLEYLKEWCSSQLLTDPQTFANKLFLSHHYKLKLQTENPCPR